MYVCQVHCTLLFAAADTVTSNPVDTGSYQRTGWISHNSLRDR